MSSLCTLLIRQFSTQSRLRGDHYAGIGLVRIVKATPDEVDAIVSGSEEYRVRLTRTGHDALTVTASCECTFDIDRFQPCK